MKLNPIQRAMLQQAMTLSAVRQVLDWAATWVEGETSLLFPGEPMTPEQRAGLDLLRDLGVFQRRQAERDAAEGVGG